jgi:hypothetical protein
MLRILLKIILIALSFRGYLFYFVDLSMIFVKQ